MLSIFFLSRASKMLRCSSHVEWIMSQSNWRPYNLQWKRSRSCWKVRGIPDTLTWVVEWCSVVGDLGRQLSQLMVHSDPHWWVMDLSPPLLPSPPFPSPSPPLPPQLSPCCYKWRCRCFLACSRSRWRKPWLPVVAGRSEQTQCYYNYVCAHVFRNLDFIYYKYISNMHCLQCWRMC